MGITFQLQRAAKDRPRSPIMRFRNWFIDILVSSSTKEDPSIRSITIFNETPTQVNSESVINLLSNSQKNIRFAASEALAKFYFNTKNKKQYLSLFEHADPAVREGALTALSKFQTPIPTDYDPISKLFTDKNESVKRRAWSIFTERIIKGISEEDDSISVEVLTRLIEHKDPVVANAVQLTVQRLGGKFTV